MAGPTSPTCPLCGTTSITLVPGGNVTQNYYNGCSCPGGQPSARPIPSAPQAGSKGKRHWVTPFVLSIVATAVGGVLAAILLAAGGFLGAHCLHLDHSPAHATRPAVTAPARSGPQGQPASGSR